jgi:hypothetical protein
VQRGDRIAGRFEILGEAGRGGMGTVFRAHDRRDRRDVAVKVLARGGDPGEDEARFAREAALLAAVHHEHVVRYVAHGAVPDGPRYLVMEWAEGETLAHRLDRAGVDRREAVRIGLQLARALGALHAAGIVHRDLKPANVMLVAGGERLQLVDLGIARRTGPGPRLTRSGALVGTAGYMAPEQARGDAVIDGRADLFALGCVLHECLTGAPAFRGDSLLALRAKVLLHDPPPVAQLVPETPAALDALVTALLARDPDRRPASAALVEQALLALGELPASPPRPASRRAEVTATRTAVAAPLRPTCAVLVALDAPLATAPARPLAAPGAAAFDGGAVAACAPAEALALATAWQQAGTVAVAYADTAAEAIDRCAHLIEQVELAAIAADAAPGGAWTDARSAARLGLGNFGTVAGRVRLA